MRLVLIDGEYHRTGDHTPEATVFKVFKGERTSEHSMFIRQMPDGRVESGASYEPLFGDLLTEAHPTRTFEVKGQAIRAPRYSLCWSALELYEPKSADQLAAARARREAKAVEREAEGNLFADAIRAEGYVPKRKGKPR